MYQVLKTIHGANAPTLGYVTSHGWTHPFLEYRAVETDAYATRFEAEKSANGHDALKQVAASGMMADGRIQPRKA